MAIVSTNIGLFVVKFGTDIHSALGMNRNNFDDPLTIQET